MKLKFEKNFKKTRYDRYVILFLILMFLYTVAGFFLAPPLAKKFLISKLSKLLNRQVSIEKIKVNPFKLSVSLDKFRIIDKDGQDFIAFDNIYVNLGADSVYKRALVLKEFGITTPYVRVELNEKGNYNFSDIIENFKKMSDEKGAEQPKKKDESPLNVIVKTFRLNGGKIVYSDKSLGQAFVTDLLRLHLTVHDFALVGKDKSSYSVLTQTESNEKIEVDGLMTASPPTVEATVKLGGIVLKKYAPYLQDSVNFDLADGEMKLSFKFHYKSQPTGDILKVDEGRFDLTSLQLNHRGNNEKFLSITSLALNNLLVDLTGRKVSLGSFRTTGGFLLARLAPNGEINLARAFATPIRVKKEMVQGKPTTPAKPSAPWQTRIGEVLLDDYTVRFLDQTPRQPVQLKLHKIRFKSENLTYPAPQAGYPVEFSTRFDQNGELTATGNFIPAPVQADLKINLTGFDLTPFQPYISEQVKLVINSGSLNTNCSVSAKVPADGSPMTVAYSGNASIARFSAAPTGSMQEILKWTSLDLNGIEAGYSPLTLQIREIAMDRLYAYAVLNSDSSINLANAFSSPAARPAQKSTKGKESVSSQPEAVKSKSPKQKGPSLKIGPIVLSNGKVDFTDNTITPGYKTSLSELSAKISGILAKDNIINMSIAGKMNNYSPMKIEGKINVANYKQYLDMKMSFNEIGLVPFTPYSSKFLGYLVQKGKLTLTLDYIIRNKKLEAQNRIYMDQFNFGNKTQSPDATTLPVRLAISLLKNRNGVIDLDIPVTGDLNDPKINIWKLILLALKNLLTRIASAPFSMLGSAIGSKEDLGFVDFKYGKSDLSEDQKQKVNKLIDALYERPELALEIQGGTDPVEDVKKLKLAKLNQMMIEQKQKAMIESGETAPSTSELTITPQEYDKYLRVVYDKTNFRKPDQRKPVLDGPEAERIRQTKFQAAIAENAKAQKSLPGKRKIKPDEQGTGTTAIERILLENIEVSNDELRQLAQDRANMVMTYILAEGRVTQERMSIVQPQVGPNATDSTASASRVTFSLK